MSSSSSPSQSQPQSQSLGGHSRCGRVLGPSLDKIIKNVAWRKHAQLVSSCKSALDRLDSISDDPATSDSTLSPLYGISLQDSHFVLQPLLLALDSASPKVIEPALDCLFNLFSLALIRGHILPNTSDNGNSNDGSSWILRLIQSASKCARPGEDAIELAVLRVLLSAVRSSSVIIPADALLSIVRTCYNIYLGSLSGTHQICAKSVLAQIMLILFKRIEHDSMNVSIPTVSVSDLLEFTDRNLNEGSSVQHTQNFINEVMDSYTHPLSDPNVNVTSSETTENPDDNAVESPKGTAMESPKGTGGVSKLRDDGFLVFKNLCKLSMKFSSQEHSDDQILLRGKILSLELLKVIMDNGGPIWLNNEMFLSAIKQYLCLSLLKNSVLTVMTIFQLLCSIFLILLLKFRSGLKAEVGIFFPMLILRVLENVLQPSFIQKMTVLNLLEKISQDPHIIIDTFVNYDCDVDAPNIFERTVNGLLKTALGPTPGSNTTLSPIQDIQFRLESVKCLVNIIRSMGSWMDQQLRIGKFYLPNSSETENSSEASSNGEEGTFSDFELNFWDAAAWNWNAAVCWGFLELLPDIDFAGNSYSMMTVNGLLKTALGPTPGSNTTLSPIQDIQFRLESVKCLVNIIRSMGSWMDQQLRIGKFYLPNSSETENSSEASSNGEEGTFSDFELHTEVTSESSDATTFEQRRAYKIEFQKGISLFNRKPSKGIEFLISSKKIGGSPDEVAMFLMNTTGLNLTVVGDYLGEREEFSLKVMHAYVDSFNFEKMDLGEAIRFFLRGFRLPGEAQKIDRIMEKFAERYCKCNPKSFTSADTAYVLAYSVIMLNTDAHNSMVKDKMTKADFVRNNRGIDDGKDLPEEYLGSIYDQIVKNEIKMKADSSAPPSKQANAFNKLLGFDGIFNIANWKQTEEKPLGANGDLIRHIQEQIKAKSGKSESIYHAVTDAAILRFIVEVSWGPMLAAFSMTLDQSDDRVATFQCLQGFRHAVHVTAVMGMQTQRDAFVTTVAKFTFLHCVADMKQKNVDAVKAIMSIAIEEGNYLEDAWEHILTCLSRFENLQLLGEGAPSDASFLTVANTESDEKSQKSPGYPSLKRKGTLQNPAMAASVRGGSYDSTATGVITPSLVTPEQMNNFILNLNLLDQLGSFELNHIFAHSQRLNSESIVAFVRALCKVSMSELQSPTDPRVFSLTKIVEIAHYNMNRIRIVWSRIWNVLSDFFVSVGLSENLSVAIFVMDSLRQLSMKFLEREELANYNFQNEFLRPFVIVMRKSGSAEIRELIVRCISQMVLSRVNNVKSGWKSVFLVFTAAAADERKNIVLLAFETMEKIVREYFPYITETETVTFTDCVKCLLTFTTSRFNTDVSLNAIAFVRFCAVKLAEGGLVCNDKITDGTSSIQVEEDDTSDEQTLTNNDDHVSFWVPLLTGLSKLASDPRSAIRKSALEVLFDILKDHGHLFSRPFWMTVFNTVIFPIFNCITDKKDLHMNGDQSSLEPSSPFPEGSIWDLETSNVAAQCLVNLFATFFKVVRSQLLTVVSILMDFIRSPAQGPASTGVDALMLLTGKLGSQLSEDEWKDIFLALKDVATSTLPGLLKVLRTMDPIEVSQLQTDLDIYSDNGLNNDEFDDDNLQTAAYVISRIKSHISMQLLTIQVVSNLYKSHKQLLSARNVSVLLEIHSSIASQAHQLNSETVLHLKLQKVCSILEISDPPMVHFENEAYQNYLKFLQLIIVDNPDLAQEMKIEALLVKVCEQILQIYLSCAGYRKQAVSQQQRWILPLGLAKKEELGARTSLVVASLLALIGLGRESFKRYVAEFFPLLVELVRSEHSSGEVQRVLSTMFRTCIGPIILES